MRRDERKLHVLYDAFRHHGEWFRLSEAQADSIFDCLDSEIEAQAVRRATAGKRAAIKARVQGKPLGAKFSLHELYDRWALGQRTLAG